MRRFALHCCAIVAVLVLLTTGVQADDAADFLAKHQAFTGGRFGDAQTKMSQMTETYTRANAVEETKGIRRIGVLYRTDAQLVKGGTKSSTGFTGNLLSYSDENGFTVPIIRFYRRRDGVRR